MIKNILKMRLQNVIFLYLSARLLVSLALFSTWSIDYGIFYSTAKALSEDKILYSDMFTHKGPAYFYFISIFGNIFGWGDYLIVLPYFFTIIYFLFSNLFLLSNLDLKYKVKVFFYILFLGIFSFQNANASLVYFQCANIIFSITFILKFFDSKKLLYLLLSMIFISISIFTRLDTISIFLSIILSLIITNRLSFLNIIIIFLTPMMIYFLFKFTYDFSLKELYWNVVYFNSEYLRNYSEYPILSMFYRPNHFLIICASGLFFSFIILISSIKFIRFYKIFTDILRKRKNFCFILLILISFFLILTWLYSRVEANHHVIILQLSLYFLCLSFLIIFLKFNLTISRPVFLIVFLSFLFTYLNSSFFFLKNVNCLKNLSCKNLVEKRDTILDIKNYKKVFILDSTGYEYILANTKPEISINNWFLLWQEAKGLENLSAFKKSQSKLKENKEITFWIKTAQLENFKKKVRKDYNKEIIKVINQGYYTKLIIRPI